MHFKLSVITSKNIQSGMRKWIIWSNCHSSKKKQFIVEHKSKWHHEIKYPWKYILNIPESQWWVFTWHFRNTCWWFLLEFLFETQWLFLKEWCTVSFKIIIRGYQTAVKCFTVITRNIQLIVNLIFSFSYLRVNINIR